MKDITITIPDNCELIKEGNNYIIKKKDSKPKSWEEFCHNFPIIQKEYFIDTDGVIIKYDAAERSEIEDRNLCVSKEEATAFLALMQLRQLRKAWVGDWEPSGEHCYALVANTDNTITIGYYTFMLRNLSFPTKEMAQEFLECFRDLCETAKCLL